MAITSTINNKSPVCLFYSSVATFESCSPDIAFLHMTECLKQRGEYTKPRLAQDPKDRIDL